MHATPAPLQTPALHEVKHLAELPIPFFALLVHPSTFVPRFKETERPVVRQKLQRGFLRHRNHINHFEITQMFPDVFHTVAFVSSSIQSFSISKWFHAKGAQHTRVPNLYSSPERRTPPINPHITSPEHHPHPNSSPLRNTICFDVNEHRVPFPPPHTWRWYRNGVDHQCLFAQRACGGAGLGTFPDTEGSQSQGTGGGARAFSRPPPTGVDVGTRGDGCRSQTNLLRMVLLATHLIGRPWADFSEASRRSNSPFRPPHDFVDSQVTGCPDTCRRSWGRSFSSSSRRRGPLWI